MRRQELHPRTALINKCQKNQSRKSRSVALQWLCDNFPKAFDNTVRIQPLKLGIMQDILSYVDKAQEAGISNSKLREAVVVFTRRIDYLACLKAREMRIDLQGNPTTMVTEEEAERAALKIKKRIEKSIRNAKKTLLTKTPHSFSSNKLNNSLNFSESSHFPERPPAFSAQNATPVQRATSVIVKTRSSKQYDPDAVARLKEKLGLSRRTEQSVE